MKKFILLLIIPVLMLSCATSKWKETLVSDGDINSVVNNIITDFTHTSGLFKKDSVFSIIITDTNDGKLIIGIGGAVNKIYPKADFKIGDYDDNIPNQYIIIEDKLFYWDDSKKTINQEIIDILKKYDHIDFKWHEEYALIPLVIDDGAEGVVYYVCKNNYKNYKKTGANNIKKHYSPPVLNCN
ncbi:MAG: hypothetical protein E6767_13795 [Dysgonomonas sp.]|nr:hypothetical protein [Dysgonomonas sp.]